ncbi:MAG: acetyl-CoA carboxylase, carboxyltransferase subunit beta [Thermoleophilia bacterium]|nr:acetyl-CoA carboxylase, carboxyltransferase subunit beta [Thermoleophilia bacterium]
MSKYVTVQITRKDQGPPDDTPGEGIRRCSACGEPLTDEELERSIGVCPHCDYHFPLSAPERVAQLADPGSWEEVGGDIRPVDPLDFFDTRAYVDRLGEAQLETGLSEALLSGLCALAGRPVALGVLDFRFLGGSMGSVVGERFFRLVEAAAAEAAPLVVVCSSGGARMQEGVLSLMQMAKTVVALDLLAARGLPYVAVLAHPTTGGVLASFATLADVIVAEPGALLCFAGPRIVEQTIREKLPPEFGRAEENLANGQLDMVVHRRDLKETLDRLLSLLEGGVRCSLEPLRQDTEVVPRGGGPLAQAAARVKDLALSSRGWLFGRNS